MKTIRYAFWALVALVLILVGLANRDFVTVRAMPPALADMLAISPDVTLPMFIIIFVSVGVGLLIGFFWEWIREHRIRVQGRKKAREVSQLKREVDTLKTEKAGGNQDDVLALLESPRGKV
ncbi:putative membrane protein [Loktanella ponticola]|uniref:Putative membrane protein n=1 Tax=Yoonia ponticola TaxID=1524255 RepID=A0A7W9EZI4_9RHOB|nr:LapA family protein [Yoonia ponticola]MBB5723744.1 putative membrane protein [Yoonia ponticola]